MKILVNGICGFMGREVAKLCVAGYRGSSLIGGIDPAGIETEGAAVYTDFASVPADADIDCIVDFSVHVCTPALLDFAVERKIPVVLATTGHTQDELNAIKAASSEIPVFFSANMSLGVALLVELAKKTALSMPDADIEIVETHHNRKLDAPSGTALMIAEAIRTVRTDAELKKGRSGQAKRKENEIGIHAVRMGNIVGTHEVLVGTQNQTITLKHEAHSRALFAEGAVAAAAFICGKKAGLYDMNSLVAGQESEALAPAL